MKKNKKETENIIAKLNIIMPKESSSSVKTSHAQKENNQQFKTSNSLNNQEIQRVSKGSIIQGPSIVDSEEIIKIMKDSVLTKSKSNDLRMIKESNHVDDDNIEEKGNQLMHRLKEGIKETKEGQFLIQSQDKTSNENNSFATREKSTHTLNKIYSLESKYQNYNSQKLAYQAYKNLSHCHSNAPGFLQRMKFYSIKNQTKSELIELLVDKAKPRMKEQTRVNTFNRLIQDSNRRAEAKNRVEILNNNNQIANNFYEAESKLNKKTPKKFSKEKWDKTIARFTELENERKKSIKEKYEAKCKETQEKEQKIVDDMKKYSRRGSKQVIESISERLYQEAMAKNIRSAFSSRSHFNSNRNVRSETEISLNRDKVSQTKNNKYNHKKNNMSNERFLTDFNQILNIKSNYGKQKLINDRYIRKNSLVKKDKGYVPYVSAEKIVNGFFKQNYLKTYYH